MLDNSELNTIEQEWYVIVTACQDCGADSNLIGPFDTEKEASDYCSSFGGTKGIWNGSCASSHIIQNSLPEKLVKDWKDKILIFCEKHKKLEHKKESCINDTIEKDN